MSDNGQLAADGAREPDIALRFGLKTLFAAVAVVAIGCVVFRFANNVYQTPWDAYAAWDGANLVIEYMHKNDGNWPKSWDDLRPLYERPGRRRRGPQSFAELQSRLFIDFDADPEELAKAHWDGENPPFRVIRARRHWVGAEPNTLVYRYLTDREKYLKSGDAWW